MSKDAEGSDDTIFNLIPSGILNEVMSRRKSSFNVKGLRINSILKTWADISKINYTPMSYLESSSDIPNNNSSYLLHSCTSFLQDSREYYLNGQELIEKFPLHISRLMNEEELWGCFYIFPELYDDEYSPVVRVQDPTQQPDVVDGVLTRGIIATCLTYLRKSPILKDYVFIKLDLSTKFLSNIQVLQHYKYLVYLDLSSNLLTDLHVLSHLLYLQYLSVNFNRLTSVLEYDTPQWFLTEIHYKFNSVQQIRDLNEFWSITVLDLSHNNIVSIGGLESLKHLRRLDLSFNHIKKLENLNHLRLLWLDVSYNNISSFQFGPDTGLWTLLDLRYLNLNDNNFTSMKLFSGCNRLRELHIRNNGLSLILEMAVFMRQLRNLIVLDIRANPICSNVSFMHVVIKTFPSILRLNDKDLDPIEQRDIRMEDLQNVDMFVSRRLLRLLYVEQLRRAHVSPYVPPADSTDVPIVVFVGQEAVGKGTLVRRLAKECSSNVERALLHTTATFHHPDHYIQVSKMKLDEMVLNGELITFNDCSGECYGLSREQAFVKDGKVKVVSMGLNAAVMLALRGLRPYLILTTYTDKGKLLQRQQERKMATFKETNKQLYSNPDSALQVLLSGRILITGILHEIVMTVCSSDSDELSEKFILESGCSLFLPSSVRQANTAGNTLKTICSESSMAFSADKVGSEGKQSSPETSMCSLYKSRDTELNESDVNDQDSFKYNNKKPCDIPEKGRISYGTAKAFDFSKFNASSTWKAEGIVSEKSSKTVTFNSQENLKKKNADGFEDSSMDTEHKSSKDDKFHLIKSISTKVPWMNAGKPPHIEGSTDDFDLWLQFLFENGLLKHSLTTVSQQDITSIDTKEDPDVLIKQFDAYKEDLYESQKIHLRNDYETIHRKAPGKFYDTIEMDDPEAAFKKAKRILRDIVNSQKHLKPMFDIDFANMKQYSSVQKKLNSIRDQIAPQRMFN